MFSFIHAADLHLDSPVTGVSGEGMPETVAAVLRDASLRAWEALVDTAIARHVSFVLLAGDVYDGAEHGIRAQLALRDGLARLDDAGIRSFLVEGNHDPVEEGWTAIDRLPELAHRFAPARSGEEVGSVTFEAGGETVTVHGTSYPSRTTTENLALRFPEATGDGFHIGLLHANVGGFDDHEPFSPASVADLTGRGIDYWALGHVHTRTDLHRDAPWVVYPGNLQGRGPVPAELGSKGALLVTVDGGRVADPQLLPLDVVRFHHATIDLTDLASTTELVDRLHEAADPGEHDGRSVVLRATVTGSGPLYEELNEPGRRDDVLAALRPATAVEPFAWLDRIDWQVRPSLDLDEARRGNDFLADLLATSDAPPGPGDWRRELPKLPTDVARVASRPVETTDPDIAARALALALDEFTGGAA